MAALPTGVEIRGASLCIWFMYRGKRCREILKGWVITASYIKKAGNLRALILSKIAMDEFDYRIRFPGSKKISTVETTVNIRTMGELSDLWLNIKETELAANTMRKTRSQMDTLRHIVGEETPIIAIRHSDILNYRNELLSGETLYRNTRRGNKIGRTVRTVDNYISLLCTVLRFAYQSGFIRHKPFE